MYRRLSIIVVVLMAVGLVGCSDGEGIDVDPDTNAPIGPLTGFSIDRVEPSEAAPGDEVIIFGPGLNSATDSVIAGNIELEVNSSIDVALSAMTGDDESDTVDGQLRFTIPEEGVEPGDLEIKVVRGSVESNVVTITVAAQVDEVDPTDDESDDPADEVAGVSISMAKLGTMQALNYVCDAGNSADLEECVAQSTRLQVHAFEIEWTVPEGATDIALYAPAYNVGIYNRTFSRSNSVSRYVFKEGNPFTDDDKDLLAELIEDYDGLDAVNYRAAEVDNFEKCFNRERGETEGSIPLICKKFNIDSDLNSLKTVTYDLSEKWGYGFAVKHAVLEFIDTDGNPQTAKANVPIN